MKKPKRNTLTKKAMHRPPADLKKALTVPAALAAWKDITPLARNEWICWVTSAKKPEATGYRERAQSLLKENAVPAAGPAARIAEIRK